MELRLIRLDGWILPLSGIRSIIPDLNERRIKEAVMRQLSKQGYQLTNDKPDLLIQYHIVVEDKTAIATEPFGYVYGPYWMQSNKIHITTHKAH